MIIKGIEGSPGISGISAPFTAEGGIGAKSAPVTEGFSQLFGDMVGKVNEMQTKADKAIEMLATGESKNLHEVMIAMEKSSISFQFLTQVRNKAIEAYHEIMKMQV